MADNLQEIYDDNRTQDRVAYDEFMLWLGVGDHRKAYELYIREWYLINKHLKFSEAHRIYHKFRLNLGESVANHFHSKLNFRIDSLLISESPEEVQRRFLEECETDDEFDKE